MSFANQFMALLHLTKEGKALQNMVYEIGRDQDEKIATLKLESMELTIDKLSEEQSRYFSDFTAGT